MVLSLIFYLLWTSMSWLIFPARQQGPWVPSCSCPTSQCGTSSDKTESIPAPPMSNVDTNNQENFNQESSYSILLCFDSAFATFKYVFHPVRKVRMDLRNLDFPREAKWHFLCMREKEMQHVACLWSGNPFCKNWFCWLQWTNLNAQGHTTIIAIFFGVYSGVPFSLHAGKGNCSMWPVNKAEIPSVKLGFVDSKWPNSNAPG